MISSPSLSIYSITAGLIPRSLLRKRYSQTSLSPSVETHFMWHEHMKNVPIKQMRVYPMASVERYAQRLDKQFVVEWFAQEGDCARRQRPVADSSLVVGCDEDHGQWVAATR